MVDGPSYMLGLFHFIEVRSMQTEQLLLRLADLVGQALARRWLRESRGASAPRSTNDQSEQRLPETDHGHVASEGPSEG
jgi:hypothetical protein